MYSMEEEKLAAQIVGLERFEAVRILQEAGWPVQELEAVLSNWGSKSEKPRVIRFRLVSGQAEIVLS